MRMPGRRPHRAGRAKLTEHALANRAKSADATAPSYGPAPPAGQWGLSRTNSANSRRPAVSLVRRDPYGISSRSAPPPAPASSRSRT